MRSATARILRPVNRRRSAAEMDESNSFGEVVVVGRLRDAIRRLNP
jgi:hypothetical protein